MEGQQKGNKGREGNERCKQRGAGRRGAVRPIHFLDSVDANKPVSTAKLMAQKPNCNLKLRHKHSVFSVPIIVKPALFTMAYVIFLFNHYD
jgi:hypothetical protein